MNVLIAGYGRMGHEVEGVLKKLGHGVSVRVDPSGGGDVKELTSDAVEASEGVIEFALAEGILDRMSIYASAGIPAVVGTTGWYDSMNEAKNIVEQSGGTLLWGSNFSVGAHLFFRLTAAAAALINGLDEYDTSVLEYHHKNKADYPSGTAITAAKGILDHLDRKKRILTDLPHAPIPADALQVAAVRVGSVPGTHEMCLDSFFDGLTIRHEARGQGGFALGAVRGLEWLVGRRGFFSAEEFINEHIGKR